MTLQVLREAFAAERLSRDLIAQVQARGVEIAYQALNEKAAFGDRDVRIEVDGRANVPIEQWKRRIRLSWASQAQLGELVDFIWESIAKRTPILTGALLGAWVWQMNGRTVGFGSAGGTTLARAIGKFAAGDELRLVNLKPYIRKAEHGFGRGQSAFKAGKRRVGVSGKADRKVIFEPTARAAQRRFRGFYVADSWVELPGHTVARSKKDQRIPTILIRLSRKTTSLGA